MAEKNFAITPSVSISRSKFLRTSSHKTSIFHGDIVPIYLDEVLPGDTHSIDVASLIRMSTPIAPIMDDIEMELFAFFVPMRLTWSHWKEFMGENATGAGASGVTWTIPQTSYTFSSMYGRKVGAYLGLPFGSSSKSNYISDLPLRAYHLICNRWFRNENVEAPVVIDITSSGAGVTGHYYGSTPRVASKKPDYFTRALPYAQKGNPVSLPLGTIAPLKADSAFHALGGNLRFDTSLGTASARHTDLNIHATTSSTTTGKVYGDTAGITSGDPTSPIYITGTNMVADLSAATAATINQLREAFQLQKALEKDALYGTRYWEILYGHFGVKSPDATLQDPEYLGGMRININVEQVLQTTGYNSTPANNELGVPGANSVTGKNGSLFTKSFVEHGYIMIMAVARQTKHTYSQGVNRLWSRSRRFDFYLPVFANLGAQEILQKEIYGPYSNNISEQSTVFGYQEAWAEYRYKPSIVSGVLNPATPNNLGFWTLADNYSVAPTLGTAFTDESRDNLARCLVTGSTGPDYLCDFYFKDVAVRPMPLYSIPGLIDHH